MMFGRIWKKCNLSDIEIEGKPGEQKFKLDDDDKNFIEDVMSVTDEVRRTHIRLHLFPI